MARKKGLGRGLGALIPEESQLDRLLESRLEGEMVEYVNLDNIKPNPKNARKTFDEKELNELAESILIYGIIQPIVLTKKQDYYEIVAGERRFRAAQIAKLKEVPAIIKDLEQKDVDMISMVENVQRTDLNPYEEAKAYSNIMEEYNLTQQGLSDILGKSRTYIANSVRLLQLDDMSISELEKGNITSTQARALLGVSDLLTRKKYLDQLIAKEITVNEIEKRTSRDKKKNSQSDIFIRDIQTKLSESIGAKVKLNKTKNAWKMSIEFFDEAQINEFLERHNIEN